VEPQQVVSLLVEPRDLVVYPPVVALLEVEDLTAQDRLARLEILVEGHLPRAV
jgi:hypothetical protein